MIDTRIFQHGATSISLEISRWKSDGVTPESFRCVIKHESHSPSAIVAERNSASEAERECVAAFLDHFKDRKRGPSTQDVSSRKRAALKKKPSKDDGFEY